MTTTDTDKDPSVSPPADADSPLFARQLVAAEPLPNPVIVVGLPRSGSSFLADVLSQLDDYFVFDDLYLHRKAKGLGVDGPMTQPQLDELIFFLGWQIRARLKFGAFDQSKPKMALEDVDRMDEALHATFDGKNPHWHELLEEWMARLAIHHGRQRWGYKAPQDFMHIDELCDHFPTVKFVYLYRDPRRVMASMKYVSRDNGHPWQYHPLVYAKYWKMAAQAVDQAGRQRPGRILFVKYEDLAGDPDGQARRIAEFLDTHIGAVETSRSNSSFTPKTGRKDITPTEAWICERVAGSAMQGKGYALSRGRLRVRDVADLAWITCRFVCYQLRRAIFDKSGRESIRNYIKQVFKRPGSA